MAGFIWTGILYFSTLSIVFITYRTFVNDRKQENERRIQDTVFKTRAQVQQAANAAADRFAAPQRPGAATRPAPVPLTR